jgi:hypothetical protein
VREQARHRGIGERFVAERRVDGGGDHRIELGFARPRRAFEASAVDPRNRLKEFVGGEDLS